MLTLASPLTTLKSSVFSPAAPGRTPFNRFEAAHGHRTTGVLLLLVAVWAGTLAAQSAPAIGDPAGAPSNGGGEVRELPPVPTPPQTAEGQPAGKSGAHSGGKYDVSRIGERGIGDGVNLYSLNREIALGKALAAQVELQTRMLNDREVTEYVNRVAQTIVRNSDAKVPFTVKVVDDDEINAFALPGGYFFVNSGLLLAAENEAELAGVMAHEIAHVAARHATRNATRAQIFNLASLPLIFAGGPAGYAIRQVAGLAVPMSFMKFSRDAEREADLLGLEYAYAAGYDPAEFVHFFETLKAQEKKRKVFFVAKAFATHPMTEERIRRAQKEIATMLPGRDEYVITTSEFDAVKIRLATLENQHRINGGASDRPVLRRRPPKDDTNGKNDSDRPTLRKRF